MLCGILRQIQSVQRSLLYVGDAATSAGDQQGGLLQLRPIVGVTRTQLTGPKSFLNAAARLVFSARRSEHVSPLLRELQRLKVPERIRFQRRDWHRSMLFVVSSIRYCFARRSTDGGPALWVVLRCHCRELLYIRLTL
jgi:hypothetical protein